MAKASENGLAERIDRIDREYERKGFPPIMLSHDVARMLNCSVGHVYRLVRQDAFTVLGSRPHTGKPIRVERREIVAYLLRRG